MSIIKHVTLQTIVAHDFRYDPRIFNVGYCIRSVHSVEDKRAVYLCFLPILTNSTKKNITSISQSWKTERDRQYALSSGSIKT